MMRTILINASNLKAGGGLQVADSICGQLGRFNDIHFVVVLSSYLESTKERIKDFENVEAFTYDIPNTIKTILLGRDNFLDDLVKNNRVDAVLTVFGPSRWTPKVPHLSGFALPHLVIPESPFFKRMGYIERIKWKLWCMIRGWSIKRSANCFWTENPYISTRLSKLFNTDKVYTVSNYYNQVFDTPTKWQRDYILPPFEGITCLSVSSYSNHKDFEITDGVIRYLRKEHPSFKIRFAFTFDESEMVVKEDVKDCFLFIGKKAISEIPSLYEQSDIMFMPTLLECFTATYPEAMRMERPIVTTDMEFACGLCGDAACYFKATDPVSAAEALYKVSTDKEYANSLVEEGKKRLILFDNYEQRTGKLIKLLEEISEK